MKIKLRDILSSLDNDLYIALSKSWEIAEDWLPTLNMESESYGSKPHFLNVEHWLEEIAIQTEEQWSSYSDIPFGLNAGELYILLSSVLFHDIGRGINNHRHGSESRKLLQNSWQDLGVISERMAREIGFICEFHTQEPKKWEWYAATNIEPYGVIRTEALAALLCLADELDTSSERTIPKYMHNTSDYRFSTEEKIFLKDLLHDEHKFQTKGGYRDMIDQVDLHPGSGYIATVLSHGALPEISNTDAMSVKKWAEFYTHTKISFVNFEIEKVFFSYLDFFQKYVHEEKEEVDISENIFLEDKRNATIASNFLARQYYNIKSSFKHIPVFNSLHNITKKIDLVNLLEDTIYWERKNKIINTTKIESYFHGSKKLSELLQFVKSSIKQISAMDFDANIKKQHPQECQTFSYKNNKNLLDFFIDIAYFETSLEINARKKANIHYNLIVHLNNLIRQYNSEDKTSSTELNKMLCAFSILCFFDVDKLLRNIKENEDKDIAKLESFTLKYLSCHCEKLADRNYTVRVLDFSIIENPDRYIQNVLMNFYLFIVIFRAFTHRPIADQGISSEYQEILNNIAIRYAMCLKNDFYNEIKGFEKNKFWENIQKVVFDNILGYWDSKYYGNSKISRNGIMFARRFLFMVWLRNDIETKQKLIAVLGPKLKKLNITFSKWLISYSGVLFDQNWDICLSPDMSYKKLYEMFEIMVNYQKELATDRDEVRGAWEYLAVKMHIYRREHLLFAEKQLANLIYIIKFGFDDDFPLTELHKLHLEDFIRASYKKKNIKSDNDDEMFFIEGKYWRLVNYSEKDATKILAFLKRLAEAEAESKEPPKK